MDDPARLERKARCRDSTAACNMADLCTGSLHLLFTGCAEDGTTDTAAHDEALIGSIDDCIDLHMGDVLADNRKRHGTPIAEEISSYDTRLPRQE